MKKLFLVRHAKSSWSDGQLKDFDRPLNKRGFKDAPNMAQRLVNANVSVDKIVSSPALRAKTTAGFFADVFNINSSEIHFEPHIYEAHPDPLMRIISGFSDEWNTVLMFGHNPGFSYVLGLLTGEMIHKVTCSISEVELHIESWTETAEMVGSLISHDYPKKEL